jgi:hypothetical protein
MSTYRIFDINRAKRDFSTYFTDFHTYAAADWVLTKVGAATEALAQAIGGKLLLTTTAANNDRDCLQYAGNSGAVVRQYALVPGKKLQFTSRVNLTSATAAPAAIVAGLHTISTDPINTPPTDGIYFRKALGSTRLFAVARVASVEVAIDTLTDMAINTDYDLEFYYDGSSKSGSLASVGGTIVFFINQVRVASIPIANGPLAATLLALSFAIQNGTAVVNTLLLDFLGAQIQR